MKTVSQDALVSTVDILALSGALTGHNLPQPQGNLRLVAEAFAAGGFTVDSRSLSFYLMEKGFERK